jgi:hypothetical protein
MLQGQDKVELLGGKAGQKRGKVALLQRERKVAVAFGKRC